MAVSRFAEEYDIERKFRETRLYQVAPISTNLILSFVCRARAGHAPLLLRMPMLPLEGMTVIAVEQAVAAPFCSSRLADAGAHVIKIERPEGDFARGYDAAAKGQSSYFVWLNRGKDSVVVDLATKEGRANLETLDRRRRRAAAEPQTRLDGQARLLAGAPDARIIRS